MLDVMYTVDVELWPRRGDAAVDLADCVQRCIDGGGSREFGLAAQVDALRGRGLKGVFFVEALFAVATGGYSQLARIIGLIQDAGQEVQLHLHPEWLAHMADPPVAGRSRFLHKLPEDDQAALIALGIETLKACGAARVTAFRGGNFSANRATLRALARNGISFDSSYNPTYLDGTGGDDIGLGRRQPWRVEGVVEVPIAVFEDFPGHARHVQICAVSEGETRAMLSAAESEGWSKFVVLSHSFEFMNRRRDRGLPLVRRRFDRLAEFLAARRDRFCTVGFNELDPDAVAACSPSRAAVLRSHPGRTARRMAEQAWTRIYG